MKRFKKIMKQIGLIILLLVIFRGIIYRSVVNYSITEVRSSTNLTDKLLVKEINSQINNKILTIDEIIDLSNTLTSKQLRFTFDKVPYNANAVLRNSKANCMGYASLFAAIGNRILKEQELVDRYEFTHLVGQLYVFKFNMHKWFKSPFFKDHDFNAIVCKRTGEQRFVDPSLRDYLYIDYVTCK